MEGWRWWLERDDRFWRFVASVPLQLLSLVRWIGFLRSVRPSLVHFNINRLVEPVIAAWILGIPSVMHFRDVPSTIPLRFAAGRGGFYALMRCARAWIANSSATADDVRREARGPLWVVPNGIDLEAFDARAREVPSPTGGTKARGPVIAMVALLERWKRHDILLSVAARLFQRVPTARVLIAGGGDPAYEAELREVSVRLGIAHAVEFLGLVENVPALLSRVDVLVHTAFVEPFGRVFVEAMAARRPVVAFAAGGAAEVVVDGETGCLLPPGDLDGMAWAIAALLENPGLRHRMGEAGRRRAEREYEIGAHVRRVLSVHRAALGRGGGDAA